MADWSLLQRALERVENSVRYTWEELDALVGGLPASATEHRAWWSGDRPHVQAWRRAGFTVADLIPGQEVTFVRSGTRSNARPARTSPPSTEPPATSRTDAELLLVSCVKEKRRTPAEARDLYVSPLFRRARGYAERSGLPWFILSAEHGLVGPKEWLAPYERYLPDTPASFREVWGMWVVERLDLLTGGVHGKRIEVHAGSAYVDPLRRPLASQGATLLEPVAGLTLGQRLAWYGQPAADSSVHPESSPHRATDALCSQLTDVNSALSPKEFLERGPNAVGVPGLYSWWIDQVGADELSAGLGIRLPPGLIYAGSAGATRWPSGRSSTNTLWSRIAGMHLGRRHEFSTFRRTLGSILAHAHHEPKIDEARLSTWMNDSLKLIAVPFEDANTLGHLEEDVLARLDPPLKLKGMADSQVRRRLADLRRPHGRRGRPRP